ncbi:MAG: PASTA domain-containing protein [Fimbriimonadaceae bacterium]|nr:PASTA domain-containing protein [Chitinophagales bacterium]
MATKKETAKKPGLLRYFISMAFWLNFIIAVVSFFFILWLALFFIKQYSRHGESQTVPNLIGKTSEEATQILKGMDLEFAVMDSTYDPDEKPTAIINQDPPADSKVKSGRKIYFTINMENPPLTEVPTIELGTSYISVREILESKGLKIDDIIYKPFAYKDVFLEMKLDGESSSLVPGEKIPKGSKIDLVLGNGIGDTEIDLPDLISLTYDEAINLIQLKELSLGSVITIGTITDTSNAFVNKQSPQYEPGKKINLGSMVDIWISQEEVNPFEEEEIE